MNDIRIIVLILKGGAVKDPFPDILQGVAEADIRYPGNSEAFKQKLFYRQDLFQTGKQFIGIAVFKPRGTDPWKWATAEARPGEAVF